MDPEFAAKDPEKGGLGMPHQLNDGELAPAISFALISNIA